MYKHLKIPFKEKVPLQRSSCLILHGKITAVYFTNQVKHILGEKCILWCYNSWYIQQPWLFNGLKHYTLRLQKESHCSTIPVSLLCCYISTLQHKYLYSPWSYCHFIHRNMGSNIFSGDMLFGLADIGQTELQGNQTPSTNLHNVCYPEFFVTSQSFQVNVRRVLKLGHHHFLPNHFQFIIHQSSYHSALCSPR